MTVATTAMHIYVFWRLLSVPWIKRRIPRKYVLIVAALLWVLFVVGRNLGHSEGALAAAVELAGMNWMGSVFLIFLCMVVVDAGTMFGLLLRKAAPTLRTLGLLTGIALAVFANVQGMRPPQIRNFEISLPGLSPELDGLVIVGVADMHLGSLIGKGWLDARIAQIEREQPDLVLFLGDIFEGHGGPPPEAYIPQLRRLRPRFGVWCVSGNHASRTSMGIMGEAGFETLEGGWKEVRPGLVIAGVPGRHRGTSFMDAVQSALADRPPGLTILLAHKPEPEYASTAAQAGVDLMLSGHTHGGQVWPFDLLVRYAYPFLDGLYEQDEMKILVSRGAGTWGPRMRLWERGDLLRIKLSAY